MIDESNSNRELTAPYPGLRPFARHESTVFFGRQPQTNEIIERLKKKRLAFVLGGSGSGKSSLIHAGVIPALRSYYLEGSGDFWIPIVFTPGTNSIKDENNPSADTPITRLANRFSQELKNPDQTSSIIDLLRAPNGLQNLINSYRLELKIPPGLDIEQANFLFVLDQFEELFHPSNKNVEDRNRLVERVIEHFKSADIPTPSSRIFVIVTMRSEHLNDCTAFLGLPEVINMTSYLVRRLNQDEIKTIIELPARRFLILLNRLRKPNLPDNFSIHPDVLEQLLNHVEAIDDDLDHLPLLQHLLARLWDMAVDRVQKNRDLVMPDQFLPEDLVKAVTANQDSTETELQSLTGNLLRLSLENWTQRLYQSRSETERDQIDALLKCLAFKDPNTGMYTQQRVNLQKAVDLLPTLNSPDDIKNLLNGTSANQSFIQHFEYLNYDETRSNTGTIKVSHESFIRGWSHFRKIIDDETERFEELLSLSREWQNWLDNKKKNQKLLSGARLQRVEELKISDSLKTEGKTKEWFELITLKTNGERYLITDIPASEIKAFKFTKGEIDYFFKPSDLIEFFDKSREEEKKKEEESENNKKRAHESEIKLAKEKEKNRFQTKLNRIRFCGLLTLFLALVLFAIPYWVWTNRQENFLNALSDTLSRKAESSLFYKEIKDTTAPLEQLLEAKHKFEQGKTGVNESSITKSIWGNFANISNIQKLYEQTIDIYEPQIRTKLAAHLIKTIFPISDNNFNSEADIPLTAANQCTIWGILRDINDSDFVKNGSYIAVYDNAAQNRRLVFFKDVGTQNFYLFAVPNHTNNTNQCEVNDILMYYPLKYKPQIAFSDNLEFVFVITKNNEEKSLNTSRILWDDPTKEGKYKPYAYSPILDKNIINALFPVDNDNTKTFKSLKSKYDQGITKIQISPQDEMGIGIFKNSVDVSENTQWDKLKNSDKENNCIKLSEKEKSKKKNPDQHEKIIYYSKDADNSELCFAVTSFSDENSQGASTANNSNNNSKLQIDIFRYLPHWSDINVNEQSYLAHLVFENTSSKQIPVIFLGKNEDNYKGWIAIEKTPGKLTATPWSLGALKSIACEFVPSSENCKNEEGITKN